METWRHLWCTRTHSYIKLWHISLLAEDRNLGVLTYRKKTSQLYDSIIVFPNANANKVSNTWGYITGLIWLDELHSNSADIFHNRKRKWIQCFVLKTRSDYGPGQWGRCARGLKARHQKARHIFWMHTDEHCLNNDMHIIKNTKLSKTHTNSPLSSL